MRILHTADWHLNDVLGRIDRTDHLKIAVERIAALCESESIDVLIIAGDLFSDLAKSDGLRQSVEHLQRTFRPFFDRNGTILAVTGNHDNETFAQTLHHAMSLAAGDIESPGDQLKPGRFFLATKPTMLTLSGVPFVLMPWPTISQYADAIDKTALVAERTGLLSNAFRKAIDSFTIDPKSPSILIAHIQATAVSDKGFRLDDRENIACDVLKHAKRFSYIALGHVHKPQSLGGLDHVRYAGSIERLDLGEQRDQKGCVVFEIDDKGLKGPTRWIDLPATKIVQHIINDAELELPLLKKNNPNAKQELVKLQIGYRPGMENRETILSELSEIFPLWYLREWNELTSKLVPNETGEIEPSLSFGEQVRDYVAKQWIDCDEIEQQSLNAKLDALLNDAGAA